MENRNIELNTQIEQVEAAAIELLEAAKPFMEGDIQQITFVAGDPVLGDWEIKVSEFSIKLRPSDY